MAIEHIHVKVPCAQCAQGFFTGLFLHAVVLNIEAQRLERFLITSYLYVN